jgi:hypothetical protein
MNEIEQRLIEIQTHFDAILQDKSYAVVAINNIMECIESIREMSYNEGWEAYFRACENAVETACW